MNKIYSEVVVITPEEAQNILNTRNRDNRPLDKRQIARYAASMKSGEWRVNGESIIFAPDGTLLDGQNRLAAIVQAGISVSTNVMYNIPEDARPTMNSGKKRTAANVLYFLGYKNSHIMAPIVRLAYIYDILDRNMNLNGKAYTVNTDIIVRHAGYLNPDIVDSTTVAAGGRHHLKPSVIGLCHLLFARKNKELADEFMHQLKTGEYLTEAHPVMTLINKLITSYTRGRMTVREQIALYIKAWNAYVAGETLPELSWNPKTEAFPVVK